MTTLTARTDADLVTAAREGDRTGFADLYERYSTPVHDFVLRLTRSPADAADVTQDTFITALERLEQLREPSRFKSWIFQIAYRRALDGMSAGRRTAATDDEQVLTQVDPDRLTDPERAGDVAEVSAFVWEVAASLDPTTYTLLDLHLRHDLGSREIADVLDITPNTASQQLSRMRHSVESAMLTFLLARRHRRDCDDLDHLLHGTGDLSPHLRREVDAHVESCEGCRRRRKALVAPLRAFAALAAVEAPPRIAVGVGAAMDAHFGVRPWWRRGAVLGALVLVLLVGGTGVGVGLLGGTDPEPGPLVGLTASESEASSPRASRSPTVQPTSPHTPSESATESPPAPPGSTSATPEGASLPPAATTDPTPPPPPPAATPEPTSTEPPGPTPTPIAPTTPPASPSPSPTPSPSPSPTNEPPSVRILQPTERAAICPGDRLVLEGTATDPEGATLADGAYRWTIAGAAAGTGQVVAVEPRVGAGTHPVVLTVTDPEGASSSDTTSLVVRPADDPACFQVTITEPTDGANVRARAGSAAPVASVSLAASASHAQVSTTQLTFTWYVDGQQVATGQQASARIPADCQQVTAHVVRVDARDPDGVVVSDTVGITVSC